METEYGNEKKTRYWLKPGLEVDPGFDTSYNKPCNIRCKYLYELFNVAVRSSEPTASNDGIIRANELEGMWKETFLAQFEMEGFEKIAENITR